jgi:hypothetical protein
MLQLAGGVITSVAYVLLQFFVSLPQVVKVSVILAQQQLSCLL